MVNTYLLVRRSQLTHLRKLGPALATGCAIVFKPAEQTPLSTLRFAELFAEVGYPDGVFNLVNGLGRITGEAMARHPDVDKVGQSLQGVLTLDRFHRIHRNRPTSRHRRRRVQPEERHP